MKSLSSFKSQIGMILKQLNSFNESDKNEAMLYLRNHLGLNNFSTTDIKQATVNRKKIKRNINVRKQKIYLIKVKNKHSNVKQTDINTVSPRKAIFKCKSCNTTTISKKAMLKHVQAHVGAPLSCIKCHRTFNGSIAFKWHLKYCIPPLGQQRKFKCKQCPREFMSNRTLESHTQGHKRNNCSYCDKVLTRRVQLMRHLLEVHAIKLERHMHKCEYCEKRYIKKCSLYYHLQQHLPDKFICLECGCIDSSKEKHEEHKKWHDLQKNFSCAKCGQKFSRRQQYLHHLKKHNQYKCVTCNESYASKLKVTRHKQLGHQVEELRPRFICPHCPVTYQREDRFHIHLRKHTDENKVINCKYCKKTFTSPYVYYKHCITVSHEKYSPEISDIVCDKCNKHFSKRYRLRQHMYRVHNILKQFVICQYCDYKTAHKSNLERHVELHLRKSKEFTCEYCGKTCDSIAGLNDHITYNHIQAKQFKCEKCEKCFKRNSELMRHQDSHSHDRPHICTLCGKSYKRLNHLNRHEERAHQIVKESRRIKRVIFEPEDQKISKNLPDSTVKTQLHPNTKIVFLQPFVKEGKSMELTDPHECVLISFSNNTTVNSGANVMDQLTCLIPNRGWNIDNDLCKIYNDVSLNDGHHSLSEA